MKIAYVMSRFPKVTETFVLYEMLALEELGVEIEIFPLLRHRKGPRHAEADALVDRARFAPFVSLGVLAANLAFLLRDPGAYLSLWRDVLRATWGSANFFFGALGILPKSVLFAREMERLGVDHVHAHFASHPAVAAFVVRRLTGIPFSFTAHGSDLHVERRMLPEKVRESALAVTISGYNRELIVRECGEEAREKVRVVHCGVDTAAFSPPGGPGAGARSGPGAGARSGPGAGARSGPGAGDVDATHGRGRPFRVACVASLEEVKGHRFLVEACAIVRERGVALVCELVGDGPRRSRIEAAIRDSSLEGRVLVRGALPRTEVLSLLARSDAAVLASHPTASGKREGIPVALMEAMARGLPVVASEVSGIPELVEDGRSGFLVPPGDAVRLADALERLAGDPALRARMGRAGRDIVVEEFDLRRNARRLLDEIRACHAPRSKPAVPSGSTERAVATEGGAR